MATIRIKGYVTASRYAWMGKDEPLRYSFQTWAPDKTSDETFLVCEHEFEVEVPDDFNADAAEIAALLAKKEAAAAEFAKTVRFVNERLAKLQAIEHTAEAA